jgi:aspartyl-tRNA(Asn)/glutamyl-tRNA(Gln) amidotransferase subunit C
MKVSIDKATITHLAHLARVAIPEAEKERVAADISAMVGFIDRIQQVTLPEHHTATAHEHKNKSREDGVVPLVAVHDIIEQAPKHVDHFVQVPKVIE